MYVDQYGSPTDPALVLIHGAGGTHADWLPAASMIPGVRVLVPDLPLHGESKFQTIPLPDEERDVRYAVRTSIAWYANDIRAMLDEYGIERAFIGGHSMGGAVALQMALDYPTRVRGLILVGTGAKLTVHPDLLAKLTTDQAGAVQMLTEWMWSPDADPALKNATADVLLNTRSLVVYVDFQDCNQFDVRARLPEIAAPALILTGDADQMTPPKYANYLHEKIGGSTLDIIPGASHKWICEQPAQAAAKIRAWIEYTNESQK